MSVTGQPLVSIVTPVYNEAEYLVECIESVLKQTYQNWDYTIVNNCSTDGSGEIARRYAAKDPRIRVYENPALLRAVRNYNTALRLISPDSKYCKVLFGDDWIFPECLERMVDVAEAHPTVGIVGAYGLEGNKVIWTGLPYPSTVVSGREMCRRLFIDGLYVFGTATALLYRADLVRSVDSFYNESNLHSDEEACVALLKSVDFGFVHQILTFTRPERPGTLRRVSSAMNTYAAGKLYTLATYGKAYLTEGEYHACLEELLTDYYDTLAGGLVRCREKKYWDYHKNEMLKAGVEFSRVRLAKVALSKLCDAVLNPKATIEKSWQIVREIAAARWPGTGDEDRGAPRGRRDHRSPAEI